LPSKVNLPPGCRSLQMEDGQRYVAPREGGTVTVSDTHAAAIDRMDGNGTAGLVTAGFREYGTSGSAGRRCTGCGRAYYRWTMTCPRGVCGAATEPE
jgi:hypothetical protein